MSDRRLPYFNKGWPIAQDKLAFKEHAAREGIRAPRWTTEAAQARGTFIVKSRVSSLGRGLRGPFEVASAVTLAEGEYCEALSRFACRMGYTKIGENFVKRGG